MSYSRDLRERVIGFVESGGSKAEASRRFKVGLRTVHTWFAKGIEVGKPGPKGAVRVHRAQLEALLEERADIQQKEIAKILRVDPSAVCHAMKRYGISRKKNVGLR